MAGRTLGWIVGAMATLSTIAGYTQTNEIILEEASVKTSVSTEYGKKHMTMDNMLNDPYAINLDSLNDAEKKRFIRTVSSAYQNIKAEQGALEEDCSSCLDERDDYKTQLETRTVERDDYKAKYSACRKENAPKKDEKNKGKDKK